MGFYKETISLCPVCARDFPASYFDRPDGMWLIGNCGEHGGFEHKVENDCAGFRDRYEMAYQKTVDHLVLPLTYRCNLNCRYCYTLSNADISLPDDRPESELAGIFRDFSGNITLIGGEPTLRPDLMHLVSLAKGAHGGRRISLGTNGQKLHDPDYVRGLLESGLDFVFLSLNDVDYDGSRVVRSNKIRALENCRRLGLPVWLQQTVDELNQLDSTLELLSQYGRAIFNVTLRVVRPIGNFYPDRELFLSDLLGHLGVKDGDPGTNPFNCHITLKGKKTKVCAWVNDMARLDPIDSQYIISDGTMTTFHRGMKIDEVLLKANGLAQKQA